MNIVRIERGGRMKCADCKDELPEIIWITPGKDGDVHLCEDCMEKRREKEKAASDGNR